MDNREPLSPDPLLPASDRLPRQWKQSIRSSVVQVAGLMKVVLAMAAMPSESEFDCGDRNPFEVRIKQLEQRVRVLTEQVRIKDARMLRIDAFRRPHYTAVERLEILQLRAMEGWSRRQTGAIFLLAPGTISNWLKRFDEGGTQALLQLNVPVNKFPELVSYTVTRLKTICPQMGKLKIAQTLCRAGLHLSASTVGRITQRGSNFQTKKGVNHGDIAPPPEQEPAKSINQSDGETKQPRIVTAKHPNHVWHVDLTAVPIGSGFWTPWFPFALSQCWPFCWWVAIVMDHFSRKAIGFAVFKKQPTALEVRTFLGRAMGKAKVQPKYIISDQGPQFWNAGYNKWCKRKKIKPRFGAIGQHGSIAIIERLNRTFKEFLRSLPIVPMLQNQFRKECSHFFDWYSEHRPHSSLNGKTPNEIYSKEKFPANRRPRIEPRKDWPRGSPCAKPQVLVAGQPGDRFTLDIDYFQDRKHLPIISLIRAA